MGPPGGRVVTSASSDVWSFSEAGTSRLGVPENGRGSLFHLESLGRFLGGRMGKQLAILVQRYLTDAGMPTTNRGN